ncbi:MAG: thiamine-phosphate kinase [Methanotrichaceae archaeon]|nr:thiamine-phosphate kinase [Methanotrichaceae archaeon]
MTKCKSISERQLIWRISKILGDIVNDDCAAIDIDDSQFVVTTDMLHRETDFPEIMTPWQIGWMVVSVNLSDIAAMGAEPAGLLIAAGLAPEIDLSFIDELFTGLKDCALAFGTRILGGDIDTSRELTLTGCAFGFVEKDLILRRIGARRGDLLCTTGYLGTAGAGLYAINQADFKNEYIKYLLEPKPKLKEGRALAHSRSVTSMMDNSDGLARSICDLSEVNHIGFVIQEESLPIPHEIVEMVGYEKALEFALSAGGDFELLFTVEPDSLEAAMKACDLKVIGYVVDKGLWMERNGNKRKIVPVGYEHKFKLSN